MPRKLSGLKAVEEAVFRARVAEVTELAKNVVGWYPAYTRVRLQCGECEGYMVYLTRQKFAACTNQPDGCKFTMRARQYLGRKADVVEFLTVGTERELWPYFEKEHKGAAESRPGRRPQAECV